MTVKNSIESRSSIFQKVRRPFSEITMEPDGEKTSLRRIHRQFSKKTKCAVALTVIAVILISGFVILYKPSGPKVDITGTNPNSTATPSPTATPKPNNSSAPNVGAIVALIDKSAQAAAGQFKPPGILETSSSVNSTVWREIAANAWSYFQPSVGVDSKTGLPYASKTFQDFTDWDLGVYIQTVIDAAKIGLINTEGAWGSTARIDEVLTFLENRPLNSTSHYPFWFYDATNGGDDYSDSDRTSSPVDTVDTGVLLVSLYNLINFNNSLATRIDNIVYDTPGTQPNNGSNYASLLPSILTSANSNSIYAYLYTSGFADFWPNCSSVPTQILSNIINSPTVTSPYGNFELPDAPVTCDPLLMSVFETNDTSQLMGYMKQIYLAHEAYYNATGDYVAFSEGNSPNGDYVYEWVVAPNGSTWQITTGGSYVDMNPIIFTKAAFGFLALYNTTFAHRMCTYIEEQTPTPTTGYYGGVFNSGGANGEIDSNSNGLIIEAALYALQK
jgi:hypothetical protein